MIKTNQTCLDIINKLVHFHDTITELHFITFEGYSLIQDRISLTGQMTNVLSTALELRERYNLPFGDGFNLSLFNKKITNYAFLKQIKFHNKPQREIFIKRDFVKPFLSKKESNNYLTINSRTVLKDSEIKHIPLLDFHIPISSENEQICLNVIHELELYGFLLNSGKSYHFYGKNLIDESKLIDLLSYALLYSPIIDRAWIAHQLIERSCCLRISPKYDHLPFLIREI